jgi:sigma-54 dependent transcriptional regulator, acetoin dehydrogenase operon transcriptional activator AcoR
MVPLIRPLMAIPASLTPTLTPTLAPSGGTLDQVTGDIIERTLADCRGNISRAARRLGVSRGLLYRRLNAAPKPGTPPAQGT